MATGYGVAMVPGDSKDTADLFEQFLSALEAFSMRSIVSTDKLSPESRLVHDVGIAGDDFDEFLTILRGSELTPEQALRLSPFIPSETSSDAYYVTMARSGLSIRFPALRSYYIRRIKSPELTVGEFLKILSDDGR